MQIDMLPSGGRRVHGDTPLGKFNIEVTPAGQLVPESFCFIVRQPISDDYNPAQFAEGGCGCDPPRDTN